MVFKLGLCDVPQLPVHPHGRSTAAPKQGEYGHRPNRRYASTQPHLVIPNTRAKLAVHHPRRPHPTPPPISQELGASLY
jgi:hypothetical protein